ncbi:MAG TPA: hypothetical protein VI381_02770 [Allosphingosinicella sp.]
MRAIGGVIGGIVGGFIVTLFVTIFTFAIHPMPKGFNPKSAVDLGNYYMTAPFAALAVIVLGLFLGGLAGGAAANAIAARRWPAWIVGALLSLYTLSEMLLVPHPQWMQISALLAPLVGAAIAHHFVGRGGPVAEADAEEELRDEAVSDL